MSGDADWTFLRKLGARRNLFYKPYNAISMVTVFVHTAAPLLLTESIYLQVMGLVRHELLLRKTEKDINTGIIVAYYMTTLYSFKRTRGSLINYVNQWHF